MSEILYSHWEEYISKLQKAFQEWWVDRIHVLADFDRTLTKNFVAGEEKPSLISVLRKEKILWEDYSREANKLYDFYHNFEIDENLSFTEKKVKMKEWWSRHFELLISSGLTKQHISEALESSGLQFREGFKKFTQLLANHQIPLVIISANGIWWESIRQFMLQQGVFTNNVFVVSNEFERNQNGEAIWYSGRVVHSFNKDETVLREFPEIYKKIEHRKNVMLLWDSLWDPSMIAWFEYENLLKVWFLNKNREKLEESYKNLYDVIIPNDGSFEFPCQFLKKIIS